MGTPHAALELGELSLHVCLGEAREGWRQGQRVAAAGGAVALAAKAEEKLTAGVVLGGRHGARNARSESHPHRQGNELSIQRLSAPRSDCSQVASFVT
jgi:hypothetical protein